MLPILTLIIIPLLAPIRTVRPDATKNKKSSVSKQVKRGKRVIKPRRGNLTNHRRRKSRATNNRNNLVRKRIPNRETKPQDHPTQVILNKKKGKPSKAKQAPRAPASSRQINRAILLYQMKILLSDPEMGHYYRQLLRNSKKSR